MFVCGGPRHLSVLTQTSGTENSLFIHKLCIMSSLILEIVKIQSLNFFFKMTHCSFNTFT